jgi:hypothetical protein
VFDGPVSDGLLAYHRLIGTEHGGGESVRSGPTAVADVELLDEAGRARQVFRPGEALRIALRLGDPAPARLELEVRDESGRAVFRTATAPVADELEFAVERLALLGGDYDLVAGDRVVGFSVTDEPGGEGVVDLRGTWRVASREQVG